MVAKDAPEFAHAAPEPKVTPETPVQAEEQHTEAEPGPAHIQEPQDKVETEEPLPEGVVKRIAKETEKAARAQAAIDRAVSERKAKEAELAKLSDTGKPGSEPAPTTAPAKDGKPVKPTFEAFSAEGKSYAEFQKALDKYESDNEAWLLSESEKRADARIQAIREMDAAKQFWADAEKVHGKEIHAACKKVADICPDDMRAAISAADDVPALIAHLAKPENDATLKELVAQFGTNPMAATMALGKIEARLEKPVPNKENAPTILPKPLATPGGRSSADAPVVDLNKVGMARFKQEINRRLKIAG